MVNVVHWSALVAVLLVSFRLFRDLADLSQWILQVSRDKTMWTFYHRNILAAAAVVAWVAAFLTWWLVGAGLSWVFWIVTGFAAFMYYSGYINPHIMMRAQQKTARYFSIEEAKKRVKPETSLIVIEAHGEVRGHPDYHLLRPHVAGTEDGLGGEDVVMTYCGLTNMGIAYQPAWK